MHRQIICISFLFTLLGIAIPNAAGDCIEGQIRFKESATWRRDACTTCNCKSNVIICQKQTCTNPHCDSSKGESLIVKPNSCCPECSSAGGRHCMKHGEIIAHNSEWEGDNCTECVCRNGAISCHAVTCDPNPECGYGEEPWQRPGDCCRKCVSTGKTCSFNGKIFRDGDIWSPTMCERAKCNKGEIVYQIARCSPLVCPTGQKLERHHDQCCPRCVGAVCNYEGNQYKSGDHFQLDACRHCTCHHGDVTCHTTDCDVILDPICPAGMTKRTRQGKCCPECVSTKAHCDYNGVRHYHNDMWESNSCQACSCNEGVVTCEDMQCSPVKCKWNEKLVQKLDSCCPECVTVTSQCRHNDLFYRHGDEWQISQCERCACVHGVVQCFIADCSPCPAHTVPVPVPGECCPTCEPVTCHADCATCDGPGYGQCKTCKNTRHLLQEGKCVRRCLPGFYQDGSFCKRCHSSCETCKTANSPSACTSCRPPMQLQDGSCVDDCIQGYYDDNGVCKSCSNGCKRCLSATVCVECRNATMLVQEGGCVEKCTNGHHYAHDMCKPCHPSCTTCSISAEICDSCPAHKLKQNNLCVTECAQKYFKSSERTCEACHSSCASCSGSSEKQCTSCPDTWNLHEGSCVNECPMGFYAENGICRACHTSCQSCIGSSTSECTMCQSNNHVIQPSSSQSIYGHCIEKCSMGQYPENKLCRACHGSCSTCDGPTNSNCSTCGDNKYMLMTSQSKRMCLSEEECWVLALQADVVTKQCLNKEELDHCTNMRRSLDLTLNGNDDFDVEKCVKVCPKGTFKMETTMGSICIKCSSGCASCNAREKCIECADGKVLSKLTSQCLDTCEDGFFSSRTGRCEACPSQCLSCSLQAESGQVRCSSCKNPKHVLQFGECVASCGDQFYADVEGGKLGTPICSECDWSCNRCVGPRPDQCLECMTGSKLQEGKCVKQCSSGFYSSNDECLPCSKHCSSCIDENTCQFCSTPYHLHENKCVSSCPRGSIADPITNECVPCPAHCLRCSAPSSCDQCDGQTFMGLKQDLNEGENICIPKCKSGFFGNKDTRKCEANNAAPSLVILRPVVVTMGEKTLIDDRIINVTDADSNRDQLDLILQLEPANGWIEVDNIRIRTGGRIPATAITQGRVWFEHDPSLSRPSVAEIKCTDGHLMSPVRHLSISVVSSSAPVVVKNKLLVVSSGESTELSTKTVLEIVDEDNPQDVTITVLTSPKFGHVISSTEAEIMDFTLTELMGGNLKYSADKELESSHTLYDVIDLQITDGYYVINAALRVQIIPKQTSSAALITNQEAHVRAGGLLQITNANLQTISENVKDKSKLVYILEPSEYSSGEVVRISPMAADDPMVISGSWVEMENDIYKSPPLMRFSQEDVDTGNIWYRDLGEQAGTDSFNFKVVDENYKPPRAVTSDVFSVSVVPENSAEPKLARGVTFPPQMTANEERITILHSGYIRYTDDDTPDSELIYNITRPISPFFGTIEHADHPYVPITVFTQNDIDSNKILFRPPFHETTDVTEEIITDEYDDTDEDTEYDIYGYEQYGLGRFEALTLETRSMPEELEFEYTVSDGHHTLQPSFFTIKMMDQAETTTGPTFTNPHPRIDVTQRGTAPIGEQQLSVSDPDTNPRDLIFTLVKQPRHGSVIRNDRGMRIMLNEGDSFTHDEVQRNALQYVHDGSGDDVTDQLQVSVTDGTHTVAKVIQVSIIPTHSTGPSPDLSTELSLFIDEGTEATLTRTNLAYNDQDSNAAEITFHVLSEMIHGVLENELIGSIRPGDSFTQEDINNGYIRYRSRDTGGHAPVTDELHFYVTDKSGNKLTNQVMTITVTPGDAQPPVVSVGFSMLVEEGGSVLLTPRDIMATDPDTPKDELTITILRKPIYGYFLNTLRSEYVLNAEENDVTFTMQDILDGAIYYVQSLHRHSEPTHDYFTFSVSDGPNTSPTYSLNITITPTNDEEPVLKTLPVVCKSGHATMILATSLSVNDEDTDMEDLLFRITSLPRHGSVVRFSEKLPHSTMAKWKMMGDNALQLDMMEKKKLTKLRVGSTFTYKDVMDELICFESEGYTGSNVVNRRRRDALGFVLSDGEHETVGSINIDVEPTTTFEEIDDLPEDEVVDLEFDDDPINDEVVVTSLVTPEVDVNTGITVEKGTTTVITSDNLRASESGSPDSAPRYVVVREPEVGYLQLSKDRFAVNITSGGESVFMQQDVDEGMLKYVHPNGKPGGHFSFRFNVVGASGSTLPQQTFHITVNDDRKPPVVRVNTGISVEESSSQKITADNLAASDEVGKDQLLFTITEPPTLGEIEFIEQPEQVITAFTQSDLDANRILYVHTSEREDVLEDKFTFTLSDGNNQVVQSFIITVIPVDNSLPHVDNSGIRVQEGIRKTITEFELKATDEDTKNDVIKFKIIQAPEFGTIERTNRRGKHNPVTHFTMDDIYKSRISYNHDGSNSVEDSFTFIVHDGTNPEFVVRENGENVVTTIPQKFEITILPVDDGTPRLVTNTGLRHLEYEGDQAMGVISKTKLFTEDPDTSSDLITYTLTSEPRNGRVESSSSPGTPLKSFTQADIDSGIIRYVLDISKIGETRDSFMFNVRDSMPNVVTGNIFHIRWSVFSIDEPSYTVKEEDGHVDVLIRRTGNLDYAIVLCRTVPRSATSADYEEFASQVQFDEHEDEKICSIKITEDEVYEENEQFLVQLAMPNYALLGNITETVVTIDDSKDKPTLEFENAEYDVNEEDDNVFVPVVRTGDIDKTVTVICFTESGSATGSYGRGLPGSDYSTRERTGMSSQVIFAPGVTIATCDVRLEDDRIYEEDEKFTVKLRDPSTGAQVGEQWNATITIKGPNDQPSVYFSESQYEFRESQAAVDVTVVRSGDDLSQSTEVWCTTRVTDPQSAAAGEDFVQSSNKVTFKPGETRKVCSMSILDDSQIPSVEGKETYEVYLGSILRGKLVAPHVAVVTINDTLDDIPTMQFIKTEVEVKEKDKVVSMEIVRTGDVGGRDSVICYTTMGSARAEDDFVERANTETSRVVFKPGQKVALCNVTIVDDTLYESVERFGVHLASANGDKWYGAVVGEKDEAVVAVTNNEDAPTIAFERSEYSIREPDTNEGTRPFVVKVVRTGDTSEVSKVRISTRDGSATAASDYEPHSKMLRFQPGETEITFKVNIFSSGENEWHETFLLVLGPDDPVNAVLGPKSQATVTILDRESTGSLVLPTTPVVVSLLNYNDVKTGMDIDPSAGYPLICVTPCDPHYPDYVDTRNLCEEAGINQSAIVYSWEVAMPTNVEGGGSNPFVKVQDNTPFTSVNTKVLDSVYFSRRFHVRCVAQAVDTSTGTAGTPLRSNVATIGTENGMCHKPIVAGASRGFQAESFIAKLNYIPPTDKEFPNTLEISVEIPHQDGRLPLISTMPFHNLKLLLSQSIDHQQHVCSNMMYSEKTLHLKPEDLALLDEDDPELGKYLGFIDPTDYSEINFGPGFDNPYQLDPTVREQKTIDLYKYLNLKTCVWRFKAHYKMNQLIDYCNGKVEPDYQLRDASKSLVTVTVPLHVSYVYVTAPTGWGALEHRTEMQFSFVYDNVVWTGGIQTEGSLSARLRIKKMRIRDDGRLEINFETKVQFRGMFVIEHHTLPNKKSVVLSPEDMNVEFNLENVWNENTFDSPHQQWRAVSKYSRKDYSGDYEIQLLPCTVDPTVPWQPTADGEEPSCTAFRPEKFKIPITFQQTNRPVAVVYSLNTAFTLSNNEEMFTMNPSEMDSSVDVDYKGAFNKGQTIFGRVLWNPDQNLNSAYKLQLEKVYLCTGKDGYIPTFDPDGTTYLEGPQYGCIKPSKNLQHRFLLLDRDNRDAEQKFFHDVPFEAFFASDKKEYETMSNFPGVDGFAINVDALYKVEAGHQWYIQVLYGIGSEESMRSRYRRSVATYAVGHRQRRAVDEPEVGSFKNGTNMRGIFVEAQDELPVGVIVGVTIAVIIPLILCCCCFVLCARRRRKKEKKEPKKSIVSAECREKLAKKCIDDDDIASDETWPLSGEHRRTNSNGLATVITVKKEKNHAKRDININDVELQPLKGEKQNNQGRSLVIKSSKKKRNIPIVNNLHTNNDDDGTEV